jgi:hypothetical protein
MKEMSIFNRKKAMSHHIEMTFAFVIFISFVLFIITFVKPYDNNYLTDSVVYGLNYHFFEYVKINIITFFVSIENSNGLGNCFKINLPTELITNSANSSFVKIVNSNKVNSDLNGNLLSIQNSQNSSYFVFLSREFNDTDLSTCIDNGNYDYKFGSFQEEEVISVNKLNEMKEKYDNDYDALKKQLAIPSVFDFAIVSDIVKMEKEEFSSEVLAKDYIYKVLYPDGTIKSVRFTIKLWR